MLPQQTQRRSVQLATRHHSKRLRVLAAHPRRRNVPPRRRYAQPERHYAILKQRRKSELEKKLSLVELRDVGDKLSRDLIPPLHDLRQPHQELVVRQ